MQNRYRPSRRGFRFFPHIVPIMFPLIFPLGIGLAFALSHFLMGIIGTLIFVAVVLFVIRALTLRSSGAAWNSMMSVGNQWRQQFTTWQPPYYQPSSQPQPPYYQPSSQTAAQPEQPYYQPTPQRYQEGYRQPGQPYYQPTQNTEQPKAQYPKQVPPMEQ